MRPNLPHLLSTLSISPYPSSNAPTPEPQQPQCRQLESPEHNSEDPPRALWATEEGHRNSRQGLVGDSGYRGEGGYRYDKEDDGDGDDGDGDVVMKDSGDCVGNNSDAPVPPRRPLPIFGATGRRLKPKLDKRSTYPDTNPDRPLTRRGRPGELISTPRPPHSPALTQARALTSTSTARATSTSSQERPHKGDYEYKHDATIRQQVRRPHQPMRARYEMVEDVGMGDVGM